MTSEEAEEIMSAVRANKQSSIKNPAIAKLVLIVGEDVERVPTGCPGLDEILAGGVTRGHILELSGPPGSPKDLLALGIISNVARLGSKVVLLGMPTSPDRGTYKQL